MCFSICLPVSPPSLLIFMSHLVSPSLLYIISQLLSLLLFLPPHLSLPSQSLFLSASPVSNVYLLPTQSLPSLISKSISQFSFSLFPVSPPSLISKSVSQFLPSLFPVSHPSLISKSISQFLPQFLPQSLPSLFPVSPNPCICKYLSKFRYLPVRYLGKIVSYAGSGWLMSSECRHLCQWVSQETERKTSIVLCHTSSGFRCGCFFSPCGPLWPANHGVVGARHAQLWWDCLCRPLDQMAVSWRGWSFCRIDFISW